MLPTVENFSEMLRDEVYTLRVMYRIGSFRPGHTLWGGWIEGDIAHQDARPSPDYCEEGFRVVTDSDNDWDGLVFPYKNRQTEVEAAYAKPFGGFVFQWEYYENNACIQIVFMHRCTQTKRRATCNIKRRPGYRKSQKPVPRR